MDRRSNSEGIVHFLVVWQAKAGVPPTTADEAMRRSLNGFTWVRALDNAYVVHIESNDDYQKARDSLVEAAKQLDDGVRFIMTAALPSGNQYWGLLPKDVWPKINLREG